MFEEKLKIPVRDILWSFSYWLETFSVIETSVKKVEDYPVNMANALKNFQWN